MMENKIILTGGGTAGHVTPNLALIPILKEKHWKVDYIGSETGVEKAMIGSVSVPYHAIQSGKLRRYFSWENFIDPFKILYGIVQAFFIIRKLKPRVIFSKGGFVAFPVVVAGWLNRIPVVVHESDITPGLANRLSFPFASKICLTFDNAKKHIKQKHKVVTTGTPIRQVLFQGDKAEGLSLCHFQRDKPCLLVIGGSQGAQSINQCVRNALPKLLESYQVVHICGKGKLDESLRDTKGYCQFEYINDELADLFALSEVIVSRSGANSLYEILALKKPHVLIPLSLKASRGDQIQNARFFENQGVSMVLNDEMLNEDALMKAVNKVYANRAEIADKIERLDIKGGKLNIIDLLEKVALKNPDKNT